MTCVREYMGGCWIYTSPENEAGRLVQLAQIPDFDSPVFCAGTNQMIFPLKQHRSHTPLRITAATWKEMGGGGGRGGGREENYDFPLETTRMSHSLRITAGTREGRNGRWKKRRGGAGGGWSGG